jgi:uracil-DNA glycosylase family 4
VGHHIGVQFLFLGFKGPGLADQAFAEGGMAGQAFVILGNLLAQVFLFHLQQGLGIFAFQASDKKSEEAFDDIAETFEHGRDAVVRVDERCGGNKDAQARPTTNFRSPVYNPMPSADPYPVLRLLQSHLEGRLRQGGSRLWLTAEAAEHLRQIVRMRPQPRPATAEAMAPPAVVTAEERQAPSAETAPESTCRAIAAALENSSGSFRTGMAPSEHPQRLVLPMAGAVVPLTREARESRLAEVRARAGEGTAARALGTLREKMVFAVGNPMAEIVLVGEAPGAEEERQGEPFVGPAGQLLTKILKVMGLERSDVYITNICKYRPAMENQGSGNRQPTPAEMASCMEFIREELAIIRPKVIVALGGTAITGLLGIREGVMKARGKFYDFEGIPVMATLHPSYLLRKEAEGPVTANAEKRKLWEDMLLVMEKAGLPISDKQRGFFLPK